MGLVCAFPACLCPLGLIFVASLLDLAYSLLTTFGGGISYRLIGSSLEFLRNSIKPKFLQSRTGFSSCLPYFIRREWDSNPRYSITVQRFSRPPHSTALASLRRHILHLLRLKGNKILLFYNAPLPYSYSQHKEVLLALIFNTLQPKLEYWKSK